jgi:hypothetical protein
LTSEELQTRKHEGRQKSAVGQPDWKSAAILVARRKERNLNRMNEQGIQFLRSCMMPASCAPMKPVHLLVDGRHA